MTLLEQEILKAIRKVRYGSTEALGTGEDYFITIAAAKIAMESIEKEVEKALTHGYHVAKDEAKGIRSQGYVTRYLEEKGLLK